MPDQIQPAFAVADFPTIQSGYVVRWYSSPAERGREVASASRDGVYCKGAPAWLTTEAARVSEMIADWYRYGCPEPKPWADILTHKAHFGRDELEPLDAGVSR